MGAESNGFEGSGGRADRLVYLDGDSVAGTLVSNDGRMIVFKSVRFGVLRVACTEAKVVQAAEAPEGKGGGLPHESGAAGLGPGSAVSTSKKGAAEQAEGWHGRISLAGEVVQDTDERNSTVVEARAERKWGRDEFKVMGRYEFASTKDETTTEISKIEADWRHSLSKRFFSIYRPLAELNKHYEYQGMPADYVLLQQDIGLGFVLMDTKHVKFRPGVSGLFDEVWVLSQHSHFRRFVPTTFLETELLFPLGTTLTHRGMRYHSMNSEKDGWESQTEITRKFTDKLRLSLVHELRRNDPDVRLQDYISWRFMVGFDF